MFINMEVRLCFACLAPTDEMTNGCLIATDCLLDLFGYRILLAESSRIIESGHPVYLKL